MNCRKKLVEGYRRFRANIHENPKPEPRVTPFKSFMHQFRLSLGYGQIFRLPAAAYKNRGGAFFYLYAFAQTVLVNGISCMEGYIGQFCSLSAVGAFSMVRAAKGIGISLFIQGFFLMAYYTQITAIGIYFFLKSFSYVLPWTVCEVKYDVEDHVICLEYNETCPAGAKCDYPELFHWNYVVKQPFRPGHPNYGYLGNLLPDMVLCSVVAWFIVFVSMNFRPKINNSTYVVVVATLVMFVVLFFVTLLEPGTTQGVIKLFVPNFRDFLDVQVWIAAVVEALYVSGSGMITAVTSASANPFATQFHMDATIIGFINVFISCITGSITFAKIGEKTQQRKIDFFAAPLHGLRLTFIVYPMVLNNFHYASICCIVFFFFFVDLGVTNSASIGRSIVQCINEMIPSSAKYPISVNLVIVVLGFLIGLPVMTRGGIIYFDILNDAAVGMTLLFMTGIEAIVVSQLYGLGLFCEDIVFMTGEYPKRCFRYIWGFGGFFLLILFFASFINFPPQDDWLPWASYLSLFLMFAVISPIFIIGVYITVVDKKATKKWSALKANPGYGPAVTDLRARRKEFTTPWRIF